MHADFSKLQEVSPLIFLIIELEQPWRLRQQEPHKLHILLNFMLGKLEGKWHFDERIHVCLTFFCYSLVCLACDSTNCARGLVRQRETAMGFCY